MEGEAVGRVIDIASLVNTRLHIFHVTSPFAVQRIKLARARGLQVTGESCPQYLLLTDELFDRPGLDGALPVCSPPIRDKTTQFALWQDGEDIPFIYTVPTKTLAPRLTHPKGIKGTNTALK